MMKRNVILCSLLCASLGMLSAQGLLGKSIATVRLTKTEQIAVKKFESRIAELEKANKQKLSIEDKKKYLELMIDEIVINQAAERDNVFVADADVDTKVLEYRKSLGLESEDQLRQMLSSGGRTLTEFQDAIKSQLVREKYLKQKKPAAFANPEVTEAEIKAVYNQEIAKFVVYPMLQFQQISVKTEGKTPAEVAKLKTRMEQMAKEIKAGGRKTFDEYSAKAVSDKDYIASPGMLYNDPRLGYEKVFGAEFVEKAFLVASDSISPLIESKVGFHILYIVKNDDQRLLKLDEVIPMEKITVREQIRNALAGLKRQNNINQALRDLVKSIRTETDIKYEEYVWKDS